MSGSEQVVAKLVQLAGFIKADGLTQTLGAFLRQDVADTRYMKVERDADLVHGGADVVTGSRRVGTTPEELFAVPGVMAARAAASDDGTTFNIRFFNFTNQEFHFTRSDDPNAVGTVAPGGFADAGAKTGGQLNFQVIRGADDGATVHTFHFSTIKRLDTEVQVVTQGVVSRGG